MSYLRYLYLFACSVSNTYCVVGFVSSSCVPYAATFSGWVIFVLFSNNLHSIT